jgi:ferredoxin
MLVIDPEECIDCNLCVPECPIDAIVPEDELTPEQMPMLKLNAELAAQWPVITEMEPAPADADEWKDASDKLQYLERD